MNELVPIRNSFNIPSLDTAPSYHDHHTNPSPSFCISITFVRASLSQLTIFYVRYHSFSLPFSGQCPIPPPTSPFIDRFLRASPSTLFRIILFLVPLPFFGLGSVRFHQTIIPRKYCHASIALLQVSRSTMFVIVLFLFPLPFFGLGAVRFHQKNHSSQISPCIDRLSASLPINHVRYRPCSLPSSILWFWALYDSTKKTIPWQISPCTYRLSASLPITMLVIVLFLFPPPFFGLGAVRERQGLSRLSGRVGWEKLI
jgi:hypothetical protein